MTKKDREVIKTLTDAVSELRHDMQALRTAVINNRKQIKNYHYMFFIDGFKFEIYTQVLYLISDYICYKNVYYKITAIEHYPSMDIIMLKLRHGIDDVDKARLIINVDSRHIVEGDDKKG